MDLTGSDVARLPWDDVVLEGFRWLPDECATEMLVALPPTGTVPGCTARLRLTWVANLRIDLVSPANGGGAPMTWNGSFERGADERWHIEFDFAERGRIALDCGEIILSRSPLEPQTAPIIGG